MTLLAGVSLLTLMSCRTLPEGSSPPATAQHRETALASALAQAETASAGDLQSEAGRSAYSQAVAQVVMLWQQDQKVPARDVATTVRRDGGAYRLTATWPRYLKFDELLAVTPLEKRRLKQIVTHEGVGAPLVASWEYTEERKKTEPFLSEGGYVAPVTVTLAFRKQSQGAREVVLQVHDPREEESVVLGGRRQPLYADFSAVSEYILIKSKDKQVGMSGLAALRQSEKYLDKLGLLSLEPPSSNRIPVIFVHGLMSRPLTWHNAFNELSADPVIRKNYQIYFFRYPSGVPVIYSSAKFRAQLVTLQNELHGVGNHRAEKHMVVIGHSMGGLVTKLQLQSSGDRIWISVFGDKPDALGLTPEERANFQQYLEFRPNPNIERVIFVCTPHRGSSMAVGVVGAIGRRLVHLPGTLMGNTFDLLQGQAPRNSFVQQLVQKGLPSSIDNLSPKSKFVKESMQLPVNPGVHIHSIVGNKSGRLLTDPKCSDGVVPYSSAHLDGVESELVVHSNHGAHERPEAIAEMRRILLLHLKTVSAR
ncbi:MAG TPA: hypothetical protein VK956_10195 [Verrucomicrobium sp.]|nr:hypothetical protein [Verrucomicrobium sp.]